jgi:hypothetical protein
MNKSGPCKTLQIRIPLCKFVFGYNITSGAKPSFLYQIIAGGPSTILNSNLLSTVLYKQYKQ